MQKRYQRGAPNDPSKLQVFNSLAISLHLDLHVNENDDIDDDDYDDDVGDDDDSDVDADDDEAVMAQVRMMQRSSPQWTRLTQYYPPLPVPSTITIISIRTIQYWVLQ